MQNAAYLTAQIVRFVHGILAIGMIISVPVHWAIKVLGINFDPTIFILPMTLVLVSWLAVKFFTENPASSCPLTLWENALWIKAKRSENYYLGGFINHYVENTFGLTIPKYVVGGCTIVILVIHCWMIVI